MEKTTDLHKLKSCPFCGGEAKVLPILYSISEQYAVECQNDKCRANIYRIFRSKEDAARAWNHRAEDCTVS